MLTAAAVVCGTAAYAQTQPTPKAPAAKPQAAKPQAAKPQQAPKKPAANAEPTEQAVLLGQFGDWGAYTATPGGKKVCFALAKPASAVTDPAGRPRDPSYAFVSTRPDEKVKNEVSVIVGFKQKIGHDASASIGSANYPMYTQDDGAWIKNAAEEAQMVDTMRKGADLVIKSVSIKDTKTTDTFSLKGLGQALDKVAEECK
ncbi:MAG TPA: invasion associated locus B family protein [Pseudolabrys sp.]